MWLLLAIFSYFINAGVYVADKFLLSRKIHSSIVYAFFVGIWSIFNLLILPMDPWIPNFHEFLLDLLAGVLFLTTLVFWYKALHQSDATRVVPMVGALVPIFSFIFSYIFLGETLTERQLLAFFILINGGILISVKYTRFYMIKEVAQEVRGVFGGVLGNIHAQYQSSQRLVYNSIVSALFFAIYYVLIKHIYNEQPFVGSFVWSRLGTFLGAVFILVVPGWRKLIFKYNKRKKGNIRNNLFFFFGVRIFAAFAFIMLNWAVSLGNVALINSLQGVQYVFLILLVLFLSKKHPKLIKEEMRGGVLLQKIIGATLIGTALYMLIVAK